MKVRSTTKLCMLAALLAWQGPALATGWLDAQGRPADPASRAIPLETTKEPAMENGLLNVNMATADQLQEFAGFTEKQAQAIVDLREKYGMYFKVDDIDYALMMAEGVDILNKDALEQDKAEIRKARASIEKGLGRPRFKPGGKTIGDPNEYQLFKSPSFREGSRDDRQFLDEPRFQEDIAEVIVWERLQHNQDYDHKYFKDVNEELVKKPAIEEAKSKLTLFREIGKMSADHHYVSLDDSVDWRNPWDNWISKSRMCRSDECGDPQPAATPIYPAYVTLDEKQERLGIKPAMGGKGYRGLLRPDLVAVEILEPGLTAEFGEAFPAPERPMRADIRSDLPDVASVLDKVKTKVGSFAYSEFPAPEEPLQHGNIEKPVAKPHGWAPAWASGEGDTADWRHRLPKKDWRVAPLWDTTKRSVAIGGPGDWQYRNCSEAQRVEGGNNVRGVMVPCSFQDKTGLQFEDRPFEGFSFEESQK